MAAGLHTQACRDILIQALTYSQANKELRIYGWVILDNHFHAVLAAPGLSRMMASIKRHTAQRLLEQVQTEGREWLLSAQPFPVICLGEDVVREAFGDKAPVRLLGHAEDNFHGRCMPESGG